METGTLTSKGQTTIPKAVREALKLKPGDKINYLVRGSQVLMFAKNLPVQALRGMLARPGQEALELDRIDDMIAEAILEKDARSRQ